eukprot:8929235-Alexandrium_andersonii.AAC.1
MRQWGNLSTHRPAPQRGQASAERKARPTRRPWCQEGEGQRRWQTGTARPNQCDRAAKATP